MPTRIEDWLALDAATGKVVWRFEEECKPGTRGPGLRRAGRGRGEPDHDRGGERAEDDRQAPMLCKQHDKPKPKPNQVVLTHQLHNYRWI